MATTPKTMDEQKRDVPKLQGRVARPGGRTPRSWGNRQARLNQAGRSLTRLRVDGFWRGAHTFKMRRLWLSLLLALSLVSSGVANAWAADDCPYLQNAVAREHSCCPDDAANTLSHHGDESDKAPQCKLGQACRTTPMVTPLAIPVVLPHTIPLPVRLVDNDKAVEGGPVFSLWRPPRV